VNKHFCETTVAQVVLLLKTMLQISFPGQRTIPIGFNTNSHIICKCDELYCMRSSSIDSLELNIFRRHVQMSLLI